MQLGRSGHLQSDQVTLFLGVGPYIIYHIHIIYYIYIILTKFPRALSDDPKEMTYSQKLCYFRGSASAVHAEEAGVGGKVFNTRFISPYCIFCRFV